jgi:hypothetical protein
MPTEWIKQRRDKKELAVYNLATAWKGPIDKAITAFNNEGFGVTLKPAETETRADIVIVLVTGKAGKYPSEGKRHDKVFTTGAKFDSKELHGQCNTATSYKQKRDGSLVFEGLVFAVIFLPGGDQKATAQQKELVTFHELIHAAGLDGGRPDRSKDENGQDHDIEGVFVGQVKKEGKGLIEYLKPQGATMMPPLRIGSTTRCKLHTIWGLQCAQDAAAAVE